MRWHGKQNCKQEWFHLECVGLSEIPARTTKWYCPDCRKLLNIGEKGEINARGVKKWNLVNFSLSLFSFPTGLFLLVNDLKHGVMRTLGYDILGTEYKGALLSKRAERWRLSTISSSHQNIIRRDLLFPFNSLPFCFFKTMDKWWLIACIAYSSAAMNGGWEMRSRKSVGTVADFMELAARLRTTSAGSG